MDFKRCPIFFHILHPLRAWNGEYIITLREQPRQGELSNGTALLISQRLEIAHNLDIGVLVSRHESRHDVWTLIVDVAYGLTTGECGRDHASIQRHRANDGHTKFPAGGK